MHNSNPVSLASITATGSASQYRLRMRKKTGLLVLFGMLLTAAVLLDVATGPSFVSLSRVLATVISPESASAKLQVIVWDLRLPIALMALLIGAMLGIAGAEMQTILNNPLADPFTLGISSAASFGAALAIVLQINLIPFAGPVLVTANSFAMALSTALVLYAVTRMRGVTSETMILVGIALLFTFNALLSLMQYAASETELAQIVFWMMGSLSRASWPRLAVCGLMLVLATAFFMSRSWSLTALRMGDEKAASLGVQVKRLRIEMLIVISLLAATAVSFVGTVAFVGLVGPHIARMIVGENQRYFLIFSAISGGLIMSLTSLLSKSITPGVIYPIGIITSLIGIPFFISLIMMVRQRSWQ